MHTIINTLNAGGKEDGTEGGMDIRGGERGNKGVEGGIRVWKEG